VEFLKHVRFCGEKQGSVPWVPAGLDAQTQADQVRGHGQPRPGTSTKPPTLGLTPPQTNTLPPSPKIKFLFKPTGCRVWELSPELFRVTPTPISSSVVSSRCSVFRIWGAQQHPPTRPGQHGIGESTTRPKQAGGLEGRQAKLTQLVVVGEAKSIDVSLLCDGEGEVSPAKGVLEAHFASVAFASDRDALGDQQALWGQEKRHHTRSSDLHPFHSPSDPAH